MFKDQFYNKAGRDCGQLSPNTHTFRRLNRRIHHNMGLLNTSRSSNHSSFRMGRTELSGDRHTSSREINQPSQQISTLPPQQISSEKTINKKMGSILSVGRRKLNYQSSKNILTNKGGTRNVVQNLYMLTNNQKQYSNIPERSSKPHNLQSNKRNRSPHGSRQRQSQQWGNENQSNSRSRLGQRQRSRQPNLPKQQSNHRKEYIVKQQNKQIRRLQQKYLQNIYQLNSPKQGKSSKRISERQIAIAKHLQQQKQQLGSKHSINSNNSSKNINQYYFQNDTQVPSTSGSASTHPNPSFNISEASLPVHSITSQKDTPRSIKSPSRLYQKTSIKLDRAKQRKKQKVKQVEVESSSLSLRWKMNNIQLQQRKDEKPYVKNCKVIEQGKDQYFTQSVFLPIQSKQQQGRQQAEDILQRIILHLDYLNIIANYTKQFRKMYDHTEQWQILIFLSYKKFYIERTKVANILRHLPKSNDQSKLCTQENPFILPYSKIDSGELQSFRGSRECVALRYELQAEDNQIRNALRGLYNLYIEKSGDHVNMFDCDNFSEEIYKMMLQEVESISQNLDDSTIKEATKRRMGRIIQTGLLIAYLNGKYVKNFAQILLHEDTIKVGKRQTLRQDCIADLFLAQFKKVLS